MFFLNQLGHLLVSKRNLQSRSNQEESFHSANTNNPRGSAAVPKPERLPFGDE